MSHHEPAVELSASSALGTTRGVSAEEESVTSFLPYRSRHGQIASILVGLLAVITTSMAQLPVTTRDFKLQVATGEVITLSAPAGTAGYSLTLPSTRGTSGALLSSDGSGGMLWVNPNVMYWSLAGNTSLDSTSSFLGSPDETVGRPLIMKTDGVERLRIAGGSGFIGIGTAAPSMLLDVAGTVRATGLATFSGGITVSGTTLINATGSSATTIGATSSTVTIGSIATTLKTSVGSNDRIVLASSNGQLDQASIASVVAAGVSGSAWTLTGNASTDSTVAFIGTTDETVARPLVIRTDGTERARFAGGSGYAGFGTASPNVQVDVNGGLSTRPATATASSSTTAVTVGNRSFIVITSDDAFASRKVTLSNGLQDGQRLVVLVLGSGGNTTFGIRLETADANLSLSGDAGLEHGDTIELIYYSGVWRELRRSANDE
ncbi:MAG: hypothetical protein RL594_1430 [Bacteroidota bacterium]